MTIISELNTLQNNLSNAYDAIEEKGGILPTNKNMNNLADSIANIPEANYTLMGNELRRAYCWSKTENLNGMCQLYDVEYKKFSNSFQATNINIYEFGSYTHRRDNASYYYYAIIDGKLYTITTSSSEITMTQQGSGTGWEDVLSNTKFVRNGYIYNSYANANNETSPLMAAINPKRNLANRDNLGYFINDGKLYNTSGSRILSNVSDISLVYVDYLTSSQLLYINSSGNIYKASPSDSSGKLISNHIITDLRPFGFSTYAIAFIYNKTNVLIWNSYLGSLAATFTFDTDVKAIKMSNNNANPLILLKNGDLYSIYNQVKTLVLQNIKCFLTNDFAHDSAVHARVFLALSNDNKIYKITRDTYSSSCTYEIINTFESNVRVISDENADGNVYIACLKYTGDEYIKEKMFTTKYINEVTTAYTTNSYQDLISYLVTTKNISEITVNNKTYSRDGSNDLVFDFIPEDLENHIFTDTDLLQSYLNAGIIQGNG